MDKTFRQRITCPKCWHMHKDNIFGEDFCICINCDKSWQINLLPSFPNIEDFMEYYEINETEMDKILKTDIKK